MQFFQIVHIISFPEQRASSFIFLVEIHWAFVDIETMAWKPEWRIHDYDRETWMIILYGYAWCSWGFESWHGSLSSGFTTTAEKPEWFSTNDKNDVDEDLDHDMEAWVAFNDHGRETWMFLLQKRRSQRSDHDMEAWVAFNDHDRETWMIPSLANQSLYNVREELEP